MNIVNVHNKTEWFQVLQTTPLSQTAVMTLKAGGQSSEEMNVHEKSDQILLVIEGEVHGDVAGEKAILKVGDVCLVPAGTRHRFENTGEKPALLFSVYAPPEYPADEKG